MRSFLAAFAAAAQVAASPGSAATDPRMHDIHHPLLAKVPAAEMRAVLEDAYRPLPDRRFILAMAALPSIFGSPTPDKLQAVPSKPGWAIMRGNERVASLPDEAGFDVLWRALVQRAQSLKPAGGRAGGGAAQQCDPFLAPGAWSALETAQRNWTADRNTTALGIAARCLIGLSLQQLDVIEVGDALPARALAALAAFHVLTGGDVTADLALMAEALGYQRTARQLGERKAGSAARPAAYVDQLRRARTAKGQFKPAPDEDPSLPQLRLRYATGDEAIAVAASRDVPYATLLAVWEHGGASAEGPGVAATAPQAGSGVLWRLGRGLPQVLRISEEELLGVFERLLARAVRNRAGPLADADVISAWYRGYFYSALYTMSRHHLDQLSPSRPPDRLAARLGNPQQPVAREFKSWYASMAALRMGRIEPDDIIGDFLNARELGIKPLVLSFNDYRSRTLHIMDTTMVIAARSLFYRLDHRPSHRMALAHAAFSTLYDVRIAQRLVQGALAEYRDAPQAPPGGDAMQVLVKSGTAAPEDLVSALEWLEQREPRPLDLLVQGYRSLVTRQPGVVAYRLALANVLETAGRHEEARKVLAQWLDANPTESSYTRADVEIRIAELFHAQGRHGDALKTLESPLRWQSERALRLSAIANEALGRRGAADAAVQSLLSRYPASPAAVTTAAGVDWGRGRHTEAAELLWRSRNVIHTMPGMSALAERFLAVFDPSRDAHAKPAFTALAKRFNPFVLRELVVSAHRAGRYRLAFDLGSQLSAPGIGGMELALVSYLSLKQLPQEPRQSLAWLRGRVPPDIANRISQLAHRRGAPEVIWSDVVNPDGQYGDYLWLMRAAELKLTPEASRQAILAKRLQPARDDFHWTLARHLAGLAREDDVFRLANTIHRRCTTAYFMGLKAEAEGRRTDAVAWYRAVLETGINSSEFDPPRRDALQWWMKMLETGALFVPVELRWALARLTWLRDRAPASFTADAPSGVQLADGPVREPQPLRHLAGEVRQHLHGDRRVVGLQPLEILVP
jgi:tetratricopeptide (TPR) repeat protein